MQHLHFKVFTTYMHQFGWLSERAGSFFEFSSERGGYPESGGFPQKRGVPSLEETMSPTINLRSLSLKCIESIYVLSLKSTGFILIVL